MYLELLYVLYSSVLFSPLPFPRPTACSVLTPPVRGAPHLFPRAAQDKVAMDLGFYYMANAMGRLVGTLLGGFLYFYTVSFLSHLHDVFALPHLGFVLALAVGCLRAYLAIYVSICRSSK